MNPLVSVIIPTYKRADMLTKAIDSALGQTYPNLEVVVVDDNNPDSQWRKATSQIMEQYSTDSRVRYICHPKNMNGSAARNTGIEQSQGEFVTFLDDDDVYLPTKVEKQVAYLLSHTEKHCCVCGWNKEGRMIIPPSEDDIMVNLLSGAHIILTNTIMMYRSDALACGGFDVTFKRHQEASFILRYMRQGGLVGIVKEVLVEYNLEDRQNAENPSQNEEYIYHYLNTFIDLIDLCESKKMGSKLEIWQRRHRGILSVYLKSFQLKNAYRFYKASIKKFPSFRKYISKYYFVELPKKVINRK